MYYIYSTILLYTRIVDSDNQMSRSPEDRSRFIRGVAAGLPVVIGYFPIAVTFGLLASEHISMVHAVFMSAWVYAGASQFMAIGLIGAHSAAAEIVTATFLMNFRHFIMSASLSQRVKSHRSAATPLIAFWFTDETFSVAMALKKKLHPRFLLGLEISAYTSWVSGTGLGFIVGAFIPPLLQESLYIALYALFVALLTPHVRSSLKKRSFYILITAGFAAGINSLLQHFHIMKPGWSLVTAILTASVLGALLQTEDEEGK
jgi:4-azaleucine resistance transporter AzlC